MRFLCRCRGFLVLSLPTQPSSPQLHRRAFCGLFPSLLKLPPTELEWFSSFSASPCPLRGDQLAKQQDSIGGPGGRSDKPLGWSARHLPAISPYKAASGTARLDCAVHWLTDAVPGMTAALLSAGSRLQTPSIHVGRRVCLASSPHIHGLAAADPTHPCRTVHSRGQPQIPSRGIPSPLENSVFIPGLFRPSCRGPTPE